MKAETQQDLKFENEMGFAHLIKFYWCLKPVGKQLFKFYRSLLNNTIRAGKTSIEFSIFA